MRAIVLDQDDVGHIGCDPAAESGVQFRDDVALRHIDDADLHFPVVILLRLIGGFNVEIFVPSPNDELVGRSSAGVHGRCHASDDAQTQDRC